MNNSYLRNMDEIVTLFSIAKKPLITCDIITLFSFIKKNCSGKNSFDFSNFKAPGVEMKEIVTFWNRK